MVTFSVASLGMAVCRSVESPGSTAAFPWRLTWCQLGCRILLATADSFSQSLKSAGLSKTFLESAGKTGDGYVMLKRKMHDVLFEWKERTWYCPSLFVGDARCLATSVVRRSVRVRLLHLLLLYSTRLSECVSDCARIVWSRSLAKRATKRLVKDGLFLARKNGHRCV